MNETTEQLKQQDLSPATIARATAPKKTWFIKRGDGMIFACEEVEAWGLFENRTNWMRKDFKIIGVSDGKTYAKIIKESGNKGFTIQQEIAAIERDMNRYRKTEEKMVFEDLIDPDGTDPEGEADRSKIKKVREIINGLEDKLEKLQGSLKNIIKTVNDEAFQAELEVARANTKAKGRIEYPSNQNIITPDASPKRRKKILQILDDADDDDDE